MGSSAQRASTGTRETFSFFKCIPAAETFRWLKHEPFPFCGHRLGNMGQMVINLPFPDSQCLRDLYSTHRPFKQTVYNSLPDRFELTFCHCHHFLYSRKYHNSPAPRPSMTEEMKMTGFPTFAALRLGTRFRRFTSV